MSRYAAVSPAVPPSSGPPAAPQTGGTAEGSAPDEFIAAVESLRTTATRPEIGWQPMRPPQRLAPWTYALAAEVRDATGQELSSGRLVLLHDPDGVEAWDGVLRLVGFATAELEDDIATDPLLPQVGWSWLVTALDERRTRYTALGGTVTLTTSTRFGDLHGPRTSVSLELRCSWTPTDADLADHLLAFGDLLCTAGGLPPEGVAVLGQV